MAGGRKLTGLCVTIYGHVAALKDVHKMVLIYRSAPSARVQSEMKNFPLPPQITFILLYCSYSSQCTRSLFKLLPVWTQHCLLAKYGVAQWVSLNEASRSTDWLQVYN